MKERPNRQVKPMKHFLFFKIFSAVFFVLLVFSIPSASVRAEGDTSPWFLDAINASEGWEYLSSCGADFSEPVIVAVIDTGCDYTHPLLAGALWENTAEAEGLPDTDDDGNGYIDDIYGIDTCHHDSDPMDDSTGAIEGHGTHVAGTVLQSAGVTETANPFHIRIMPIKAGNTYGDFNASDLAEAIRYAADNGASVINMSISSDKYPLILQEAIEYASERAILVASAGNKGLPTSDSGYTACGDYYPAGSALVAGVMSYSREQTLSSFSNWDFAPGSGAEYEIAAPGESISSCTYGAAYKVMSGTSAAAGIASGCAALLCARYRDYGYSARELTAHLMHSGTEDITYTDLYGNSHTFSGIRLPGLLSEEPRPALTVKDTSAERDKASAVLFSYTLENRGINAHNLTARLTCGLPGVSVTPGSSPLPDTLNALSQYNGSFLLTLPEEGKEIPLTLQICYEDAKGNSYTLSHSISVDLSPEHDLEPEIPLLGISVSAASPLLLQPGDTCPLLVTYIPENTTADRTVTFSSSNPLAASVNENGVIAAHGDGTALITVTSSAGHVHTRTVTVYTRPEDTDPDPEIPESEPSPEDAESPGAGAPPENTGAPGTNAPPADSTPSPGKNSVAKGKIYIVNRMKYRVTKIGKNKAGSVTLTGTTRKRSRLTSLNIKDTVMICGKSFRVTAVGTGAFRGYSRLRRVRLGIYIKTIKKDAFRNCRRLKKLTVRSRRKPHIGKNALKGISPKANKPYCAAGKISFEEMI